MININFIRSGLKLLTVFNKKVYSSKKGQLGSYILYFHIGFHVFMSTKGLMQMFSIDDWGALYDRFLVSGRT